MERTINILKILWFSIKLLIIVWLLGSLAAWDLHPAHWFNWGRVAAIAIYVTVWIIGVNDMANRAVHPPKDNYHEG